VPASTRTASSFSLAVAEPEIPPPQMAQGGAAHDDALVKAAEAQRRADELQRQSARQPTTDPELSAYKQAFLRDNPEYMEWPRSHLLFHHHQLALAGGIPDDSEAMTEAVKEAVEQDVERLHRYKAEQSVRSHNMSPKQSAAGLQREAEQHLAEHQPASAEPPLQPRRSIPMSAPVSRDNPMSGQRTSVTLSPEERHIAAVSRPDLPREQAERLYAKNKALMLQRKASGEIQDGGR